MCGDSITVVHPLFQTESDGSIPISPLQLEIIEIDIKLSQHLNELWHSLLPITNYSNLVRNKIKISYGAIYKNRFYAVAIWTTPIAANRIKNGFNMLELRRMAISPEAPKNTGSRMLSIMAKMIKQKYPSVTELISYQSTEHHSGTIYKAANWKPVATSKYKPWHVGKSRSEAQTTSNKIRWQTSLN